MSHKPPPAVVRLGYEVPSGSPFDIPTNGHLCVTGMTQQSGKTTALEALIERSGKRAITFITKRGERSFENARRIPAYFSERGDWQFVESIMEAAMRQKMRFERSWIMRASRGARTLADVNRNIEKAMETARGMNADIYLQLHEYLKIVLPQLDRLDYKRTVSIGPGVNVMDLSAYSSELQALVIRSVLEWVHEKETNVTVVIPEAWETLPEGRGSPVKLSCEQIFRKGAGIGNLIWLDSQDIAGVWKEALRACSVWIMGVQSEIHEVKRMLAHLPTPNALKPKPEQVMTLKRGQFYVRYGAILKLIYVQPAWMRETEAIAIAQGKMLVSQVQHEPERVIIWPTRLEDKNVDFKQAYEESLSTIKRLESRLAVLENDNSRASRVSDPPPVKGAAYRVDGNALNDVIFEGKDKQIPVIELNVDKPEIEVTVRRFTIKMSDDTFRGQLARLVSEGFFDAPKRLQDMYAEYRDRGWMAQTGAPSKQFGPELQKLIELGFMRRVGEGTYQIRDGGVKVRVKEVEVEA